MDAVIGEIQQLRREMRMMHSRLITTQGNIVTVKILGIASIRLSAIIYIVLFVMALIMKK